MKKPDYRYQALVERVVDGDTVVLLLDLGFDIHHRMKCRLARINAPEMSTPEGPPAKEHLTKLLPVGQVTVHSTALDKYGRALVEIFVGETCVNDAMLAEGYAKPYAS